MGDGPYHPGNGLSIAAINPLLPAGRSRQWPGPLVLGPDKIQLEADKMNMTALDDIPPEHVSLSLFHHGPFDVVRHDGRLADGPFTNDSLCFEGVTSEQYRAP